MVLIYFKRSKRSRKGQSLPFYKVLIYNVLSGQKYEKYEKFILFKKNELSEIMKRGKRNDIVIIYYA